jgi:NMD protein affecting ribosome stability and mRNA decay
VPVTIKQSKKLVGQDDHSNTFDYKYTSVVEILPVRCVDNLQRRALSWSSIDSSGGAWVCAKISLLGLPSSCPFGRGCWLDMRVIT